MTKKQALNYLRSSGFSKEQIQAIVGALSSSDNLSSGTRKNSKKLEKGNDLAVDCNNCKNNCYRGDETSYCATGDGMCHYECEKTTKNDLGVDCISRQAVIDEMEKRHTEGDCITKGFIKNMPSVTPIRPKGHWIEHEKSISTAFKHLRECSCCKCYFDWMMPRNSYCPNCGADMREVVEE